MLARLRHAAWEPAVFPLADDAGALLVGGPPLRELQAAEAAAAGHELRDVPAGAPLPAGADVACALDAVFSRETLAALADAARQRGGLVQAAVARGTALYAAATRMHDADGDLPLPLWAGPLSGLTPDVGGDAAAAFPTAARVPVCDDDHAVDVRVPPYGAPPHVLRMPAVSRLGGRVRHWLDVLELSLAASATRRGRLRGKNKLGDVDIHPTATVINSILADGVRLEPHASVIDSVVGRDVLVADHSVLHTCVVGDNCRTLVDTSLRRIVAMQDSTLSNLGLSDVVIGRNVFLTTAVATFALPGDDVVVEGRDTHRAVLGGALGARCILGSRALLKAGTALPPGLLVVARPGEAATKLDDDSLARATMIRGNRRDNV